jgi:hypothetical protein
MSDEETRIKKRKRAQQYYMKNIERIRERSRRYYAENGERVRERCRKYREAQTDKPC